MQFKPKTEDEVQAAQLAPVGLQPFTVMEASVVVSKSAKNSGKEMLKLKLNVHADDGFDYHIYDYVAPWFMEYKFRHFFFACERGADYDTGTISPETLVGCQGYCDIGIEKGKEGFSPKNKVNDYNVEKQKPMAEVPKPVVKAKATVDDDVPF